MSYIRIYHLYIIITVCIPVHKSRNKKKIFSPNCLSKRNIFWRIPIVSTRTIWKERCGMVGRTFDSYTNKLYIRHARAEKNVPSSAVRGDCLFLTYLRSWDSYIVFVILSRVKKIVFTHYIKL